MTETAAITDDMCRAAIAAGKPDRIQGFSYGPEFGAPHVLRDLYRQPGSQEIWRGDSHDEMMERHAIERMRLQLAAALSASPAPAVAEGWMPIETAPKDVMVKVRPGRDDSPAPYEFAYLRPRRDPNWRAVTDNRPLRPTQWMPLSPAPSASPAQAVQGEALIGALVTVQTLADNNKAWPNLHAAALEQISMHVAGALAAARTKEG